MRIILASKSPRRAEILSKLGFQFEVFTSDAEEKIPDGVTDPCEIVKNLALCKGTDVAKKGRFSSGELIISADTLVFLDGKRLGKPSSNSDAVRMLSLLSGRTHTVITGFAIICGEKIYTEAVESEVRFKELTEEEISAYVATGEPSDKAGAYGVQGLGGVFVERINGDYFNVMGLPACALCKALKSEFGVDVWKITK